jgi:outer membrane receptor for monomeric catechols
MNEEDEAFNEIERRSKAKKDAVESSVNAKEALTKLLLDSYEQGVKDGLEVARDAMSQRTWAGSGDLEDSNAYLVSPQRTWVGLTDDEIKAMDSGLTSNASFYAGALWAESKLKEKNT